MRATNRPLWAWLTLAVPLIAIKLWVLLDIGYYDQLHFARDAVAAMALCAVLVLAARWRVLAGATWVLAWLLYVLALLLEVMEALSYYFQGTSFSARYFAHVRLDNIHAGLEAFPLLLWAAVGVSASMFAISGWVLGRQSRRSAITSPHSRFGRVAALVALAIIACAVPSAAHRLVHVFTHYDEQNQLALSNEGRAVARRLNLDPLSHANLHATPGKNLVIIYMESLEAIYTDDHIFPGLTPNLNRLRAQGLEFANFQTFPGVGFTMAGLFASQCGAPFYTSPWKAFSFDVNNNSAAAFQPRLVCLGDVLHAAGYQQLFMKGASLTFANQGTFFYIHGFQNALGREQIERTHANALPLSGWGLYDRDLFTVAADHFDALASTGKPFNLDLLTVDTHPPHGRPSPGCPAYKPNTNDVLQSVHCTDFLVGKFLEKISKNPAYKNTIVVVMSDHQSMRNDSWPLFPSSFHRRPFLFVLNAGQGVRDQLFYHMDIAPTVLHLMGVETNAQFIAGSDRSEPGAAGSSLAGSDLEQAVLRQTIWSHASPISLCHDDTLIARDGGFFAMGKRKLVMSWFGGPMDALPDNQVLAFVVDQDNIRSMLVERHKLAGLLDQRKQTSILTIRSLPAGSRSGLFSVDWFGRNGAVAHIADTPRLRDLAITSADCKALLARADDAASGTHLDLSDQFVAQTAPAYPQWPRQSGPIPFSESNIQTYGRELGWHGSSVANDEAAWGFRLPEKACHSSASMQWRVKPILHLWRPEQNVRVFVNGQQATVWRFHSGDNLQWQTKTVPLSFDRQTCDVLVRFVVERPNATVPSQGQSENPRHFQFSVKEVGIALLPTIPSPPVERAIATHTLNVPLNGVQTRVDFALQGAPQLSSDRNSLRITVKLTNNGTATLVSSGRYPVHLGAHLLDADGRNIANDFARAALTSPLAPGRSETVTLTLPRARLAGHEVAIVPVQEDVGWFDRWGIKPLLIGPFSGCKRNDVCDPSDQSVATRP